jgi:hypothetical protein
MNRAASMLAFVLAITIETLCAGQPQDETEASKAMREKRMERMRQRVAALKATGSEGERYEFRDEPILRYNDAARGILDASVWALGREGRPRAVLIVEIYGTFAQYELTAVDQPPKRVDAGSWQWTPNQADYAWTRIPIATPPAATKSGRQRQLKQLTQDFAASEQWRGQTYHLRLMPQPIYEYEDKEQGVLHGAVFAWAHGTNVEAFMFLEARQDKDNGAEPHFVAGFSRSASASLKMTYEDEGFWSSPEAPTAGPASAYFFRSDPLGVEERAVFVSE